MPTTVLVEDVDRSQQRLLREHVGFVWVGDDPGIRLRVWATPVTRARALIDGEYGLGHVVSIWNEDDAHKLR